MIIETSANQFYRVVENLNSQLSHCWDAVAVKKVRGEWVDKAKARVVLVRKIGCRVVQP
jgi:hypothetical protein